MHDDNPPQPAGGLPGCQVDEVSVPQLVGQVYAAAPVADKARLLQYLLPTLGVLPLIVVANGLFARIRLRDGWSNFQVRVEDLQQVGTHDVVSLVERVQLAGSQLLDGLAQTLAGSPALATTAAAGILIVLLTRRAAERRSNEDPLRA